MMPSFLKLTELKRKTDRILYSLQRRVAIAWGNAAVVWKACSAVLPLLRAIQLQCCVELLTTEPFKEQFSLHTTLKNPLLSVISRPLQTPTCKQWQGQSKCTMSGSAIVMVFTQRSQRAHSVHLSFSISIQETFHPLLVLLLLRYRKLLNSSAADLGTKNTHSRLQF